MLRVAEQIAGAHIARIHLHEGYIDAAPDGPFDGAACLLILHFVSRDQRLETLRQVHRRLVPNAPFVVAHISFAQTEPERSMWLARHIAFGGTDRVNAENAKQAIATKLSILSPEEDEATLREAVILRCRISCIFWSSQKPLRNICYDSLGPERTARSSPKWAS